MSEQSQHNDFLPQAEARQDVAALLKKMQQQLDSLEKKIDNLVNQYQPRPFREKYFPKPSRPFGRSHRRFDREHDNVPGEKSFYPGRHFEKRHSEESRGFGYKKKPYDNPQGNDFSQERHFNKGYGGKRRGFDQKKKPFSYKRKDHV